MIIEISSSEFEQNIKESILIILETCKMERVMRPDFGCGIHERDYYVIIFLVLFIRDRDFLRKKAMSKGEYEKYNFSDGYVSLLSRY